MFLRIAGKDGITFAANDNRILHLCSRAVDLIQNISGGGDRKADDCNAARASSSSANALSSRWHGRCSIRARGFSLKGDFDHAVDDSGDSSGFVVNRLALERWRQPHSPAAGCSRGCFDY